MVALPDTTCHRGVGCTQVVNAPSTILYFLGPSLWISRPRKMRIGFLRAEHALVDAVAERRHAVRLVERAGARLGVELHPLGA